MTRKRHDGRGLAIYTKFKDTRGCTVTVKQSSAYGLRNCWLFCTNTAGSYRDRDTNADVSPHLTVAQARRLAKALLSWVDDVTADEVKP